MRIPLNTSAVKQEIRDLSDAELAALAKRVALSLNVREIPRERRIGMTLALAPEGRDC